MQAQKVPTLLTTLRIAEHLAVPLPRVVYILATRRHILPAARAGTIRLYDQKALALVRHELNRIDARRRGKGANDVE